MRDSRSEPMAGWRLFLCATGVPVVSEIGVGCGNANAGGAGGGLCGWAWQRRFIDVPSSLAARDEARQCIYR